MMQNEMVPAEKKELPQGESSAIVWPAEVYPYHAGIVGGAIGGLGMAIIGMIAGVVIGRGPWYPVNLLAAGAIPGFQTMTPEQLSEFNLAGLFVGAVLHFTISIAIGLLFSILLPMFPGHPVAWSIIAGGILWVFADIVLLPLLNPRMAELVDVPSFIIAHLAYTLLLGITVNRYKKMPVQSARLTELYPYQAGVVGGILGGTAMAMVGIIAGLVIGRGPWYPINLLAAIAVRNFQTMTPEQLSQFSLSGLFVGTVLHLTISIVIGFIFAVVLSYLPGHPLIWSLIGGGVLWIFADVVLLLPLNPIMASLVDVPSFLIAHVAYTIVLGLWVSRYEKIPIM
jgi:uncharacterized membrane protein YagU involved in acid resistance